MSSAVISSFLARKRLSQERRQLEPICNALQQQNNKLAFRLCTKALDKSPDYHIAKALRAVCLFRLARYQEALNISNELATNEKALGDADVLLFVGWIFAEVGQNHVILDMFDEATRLHGGNEDVGIEAFCHFVRVGETKRMQQLALKMYKSLEQPKLSQLQPLPKPSTTMSVTPPKYLYWCLMSIILQALALPALHPTSAILCSLGARLVTSARSLIGAKEMALGDTAQEFFIRTRLIAVRVRGWKRPANGAAPPPTTSPLPAGSSDADYARAELLNAFVGPDGNKWCDRHLGLELWRREQEWEIGGEHEWERGRGRCMKKLREGDTNWSTVLYLIRFTLRLWHARQQRANAAMLEPPPVVANGDHEHHVEAVLEPETVMEPDAESETSDGTESVEEALASVTSSMASLSAEGSQLEEAAVPPTFTPVPVDMITELLRWTYDRLFSLAHAPEQRKAALKVKSGRSAKGKGKAKAAEIDEDSDEEREKLVKVPRRDRGFLLGLLELVRLSRLENVPLPSKNSASLPELVVEYLEMFGDKVVCFEDLEPYLRSLSAEERAFVLEQDLGYKGAGSEDADSPEGLQSSINVAKIRRYLVPLASLSHESESRAATQFLSSYFAGLPLGKGLPETDLQPADDFALLSAQAQLAAHHLSGDRAHCEKAVVILEFAIRRSRFKYQVRILLIRLYLQLGAPALAQAHYEALDPKQVQHDTLAHLLLTRASTFSLAAVGDAGLITEAAEAVHWYRSGEKEASEACVRTWSRGTFTKIEEYVEFRDRLQHSLSKRLSQLEHVRMRLLQGPLPASELAPLQAVVAEIASEANSLLYDNRDYSVIANLQPQSLPHVSSQTAIGPTPLTPFLFSIANVYRVFIETKPSVASANPVAPELATPVKPSLAHYLDRSDNLTDDEKVLVAYAEGFAKSHSRDTLSSSGASQDELATFLRARLQHIDDLLAQQPAVLPWRVAHAAQISLEAFCLTELAFRLQLDLPAAPAANGRSAKPLAGPTPANSKSNANRARMQAALDRAGSPLRSIAERLATYAAGFKGREATARVSELSSFPLLDGFLDQTAEQLAETSSTFFRDLSSAVKARSSHTL